nr:hypothetical protein [Candidatus Sigynarchaeum springense]
MSMQGAKNDVIDVVKKMPKDASLENILDEIGKLATRDKDSSQVETKTTNGVDREAILRRDYPGMYVALVDDAVIESDASLRKLHGKLAKRRIQGQECLIRFIESGAPIYAIDF